MIAPQPQPQATLSRSQTGNVINITHQSPETETPGFSKVNTNRGHAPSQAGTRPKDIGTAGWQPKLQSLQLLLGAGI